MKFSSFKLKPAFLLAVLLTVLLLMPQLKTPWMLIDDGENLRMGQEISRHFASGDWTWILAYEKDNGRFRPAYWLWHFANFKIFGFNSFGHHFGHLFLYVLISILVFLLTLEVSRSNLAGFLAVSFLLFFYPAAENYFRLGTAEPPLLALYLVLTLLLAKFYFSRFTDKATGLKKTEGLLLFVILGFAYFMKETSSILLVAFFPLLLIGFLDSKIKNKKAWVSFSFFYVLANVFFFVLVLLIKRHYEIGGGYTEGYMVNLVDTIRRFVGYLKIILREYKWVLIMPAFTFTFSVFNQFRKNQGFKNFFRSFPSLILWQAVLLSWFFMFLAIQAPWVYVMGRYLPPVIVWLAIFLAIEYAKIFSYKDNFFCKFSSKDLSFNLPVLKMFSLLVIFWLVLSHGKRINLMYQDVVKNERYTQNLVGYLAKQTPYQGSVYANFSDGIMEYLYELPLHFRFFYQRPDIKVDYLLLDKEKTYSKGDFIIAFKEHVWRYPWEEVKEAFNETEEIRLYKFGPNWSILVFKKDEFSDSILED